MSDAFPPGFFDRIREEMGVAEGRSTGVQQGRLYYSEREMLTQARAGEHVAPADVVKLLERLARYRGPVSHEPQERWHIRLADEVELRNAVVEGPLGPLLGGGCEVVRAEPREGEQEGLVLGDPPHTAAVGLRKGVGAPLSSPSIASELRRTASRLRDPEYHWYEHAAVTLERLAEELEKDYSLAEARGLREFVAESNRIEGILREPTGAEVEAHERLLALSRDEMTVDALQGFVAVVAPGKPLRDRPGLDVRVGGHLPPPGGSQVRIDLEALLADVAHPYMASDTTPYEAHREYETLHPFMDGNGRSGRALWAWMMQERALDPFALPFLHRFYYQALEAGR